MTVFESEATIRWLNSPPEGTPRMTVGSGMLVPALRLSVDPEAASPVATSPGELLAGAIGTIFAWFVAEDLLAAGTRASELTADVTLTASNGGEDLTDVALNGIAFRLVGRVPNIGQEQLDTIATGGMRRCVETLGLRRERLAIAVETVLENG
jgi:hypothetical protein